MPLNTVAKATSANSNTPSRVIQRQDVKVGRQTASTARAEALKARLSGQVPAQSVVSRPMGSTARRDEIAQVQKFQTIPSPALQAKPMKAEARRGGEDLSAIAPPPSGLAPGSQLVQPTTNVEPTAPTVVATDEQLSPQYVALARKEKQLRKAQLELKAAQDAWKQEQANYIPKQQLTSDTLKVLSEAGITPDKLVELQLNQAAQDPNQALLDKITQLEAKLNGITDPENGTLAQRDKQASDQAVAQIRSDVKLLVDSNPTYGTIKSEGNTEDVVSLIISVFNEEGIILDVEEAATLVEDKLADKLYQRYEKISQYEKIKARLGKRAEDSAEANTVQQTQQTQPNRVNTLTNAGSATARPLSARDKAVLAVQARLDAARGKQ